MTSKLLLLVEFINILTIINSIHDVRACENILSIYKELGCKHVNVLANDNCTGNFKCPDFNEFDEKKCIWNGTSYDIGQEVVDGLKVCHTNCGCIGHDDKPAQFKCWATMADAGLYRMDCMIQYKYFNECHIYDEDSCDKTECLIDEEICDHDDIVKLKKCHVQGRMYNETEKFSIDGHECLCTENFDNTTLLSENSSCAKISFCGIESISQMLNGIREGCVPVFRESNRCPIEYKCPSNDEVIQPDTKSNLTSTNDATCTFGNLILKRGEHLETQAKRLRERNPRYIYTECICNIPPFITCIKYNL